MCISIVGVFVYKWIKSVSICHFYFIMDQVRFCCFNSFIHSICCHKIYNVNVTNRYYFMQKEERNLDVECAEDDAIRTVPSGQSSIIIDPSQSLQVLSVPGSEEHIVVHFIPDNTNITMDQAVSFIFVTIFEFRIPVIS